MTLGIEVVGIERSDPAHPAPIVVIHQVIIRTFAMAGVERVIADHGQGRLGEVILDDVIQVLVVAPGEVDAIEPAARFVDAACRLILGDIRVGVFPEELGEDDLV